MSIPPRGVKPGREGASLTTWGCTGSPPVGNLALEVKPPAPHANPVMRLVNQDKAIRRSRRIQA